MSEIVSQASIHSSTRDKIYGGSIVENLQGAFRYCLTALRSKRIDQPVVDVPPGLIHDDIYIDMSFERVGVDSPNIIGSEYHGITRVK